MINVTVGNNTKRERKIVEESTTLRELLEEAGVDYTRGTTHLDGSTLMPGDLDKSFADLGITSHCFLQNVAKVENA